MATVLPIVITVYLLYWFAVSAETWLGTLIKAVLPDESLYWPGMGLMVALVLIFVVGMIAHAWIVRQLITLAESLVYRVPLVKSVYGAIHDFFALFSKSEDRYAHQVVMVDIGNTDMRVMGFVMREHFTGLPQGIGNEGEIAVYIPLSYQIGGATVIMPRAAVHPIEMPMEEAMRFIVTAGLTTTQPGPSNVDS